VAGADPVAGAAPVPAPAPASEAQPLAEHELAPAPDARSLDPVSEPEPTPVQERISLDGVPALVAQERLAGSAAATPSGDEPRLVQIAQVRDDQKDADANVEVPLEGDRLAEPTPPATARPPELPRTGFDLVPMATMGLVMMVAGLAMLRTSACS